jgi:hypothetical protein
MPNKDNSDLVNSLRVQLAGTEIKLEQANNKADQEEKYNIECNANAVFLQFQLDTVRKEAIAQISYLTRRNRRLNLEIKRLKSENANNPQETSN